ncbi:MAG: hypothetical protein DRG40_01920 [Deltaproteobacteria bacterium]|nr:MAG: hypothetical protein DRG40_01920 [Deltaproteobacteria bacterium]
MIITVILHVMRVFFIAAYRKPRELCWVAGSLLLLTTWGWVSPVTPSPIPIRLTGLPRWGRNWLNQCPLSGDLSPISCEEARP